MKPLNFYRESPILNIIVTILSISMMFKITESISNKGKIVIMNNNSYYLYTKL